MQKCIYLYFHQSLYWFQLDVLIFVLHRNFSCWAFFVPLDLQVLLIFFSWLAVPQDFDSFRQPNMHHGMEACLGLSMGPICSRFNWSVHWTDEACTCSVFSAMFQSTPNLIYTCCSLSTEFKHWWCGTAAPPKIDKKKGPTGGVNSVQQSNIYLHSCQLFSSTASNIYLHSCTVASKLYWILMCHLFERVLSFKSPIATLYIGS